MKKLGRMGRALLAGLPLVAAACGGGTALQLNDVTPQSVPALQAERAQKPNDAMVATRLGVAYFRANQLPEARAVLDTAVERDPQNGIAAIYRGMTAESQGDFLAARTSYDQFIRVARSNELKSAARQRLALVDRRELEYSARQALSQEAELSQLPPEPNTVAVMPFGYTGANEEIRPLSRGFAQLIVTDLARSRQLRVLERERMQAMLDEMRLSEQGRTDPQSAARSGRMLRAGRVVQGSLTDQDNVLRATGAVVDVNTAGVAPGADAALPLNRLFDMEKVFVFDLFNAMGITLTEAERAAINQRPTQNLQAFLAWSRGLEAEDRGDFVGAQEQYNQAVRLDPSFSAASASAQTVSDIQQASSQSVADVDVMVTANAGAETGTGPTSETTRDALANASDGTNPGGTTLTDPAREQTPTQPPDQRKPTDATGNTGIGRPTATIRIIIPRP